MKRRFLTVLLLLVFFTVSCSKDMTAELEVSYTAMDYGKTIRLADRMLREKLDPDALFYKAMSYYKMGDDAAAYDASLTYGLIYTKSDEHYYDMMRLILHTTEDDAIAVGAGKELYATDRMTKQDYISFYTAAAREKDEKLAEEVYIKVTPMMTAGEIAMMNVLAEAPSLRILSSLERLYQTEGLSKDFVEVATLSIPLFINRGEGELLYETVKRGYGGNYSYALYIGDLMYSLGRNEEAAIYWNAASEAFPREAGKRLREIGL